MPAAKPFGISFKAKVNGKLLQTLLLKLTPGRKKI